jgi:hypothetical protein
MYHHPLTGDRGIGEASGITDVHPHGSTTAPTAFGSDSPSTGTDHHGVARPFDLLDHHPGQVRNDNAQTSMIFIARLNMMAETLTRHRTGPHRSRKVGQNQFSGAVDTRP